MRAARGRPEEIRIDGRNRVRAPNILVGAPNILVRAPNWTGDLVMATPGFRALRAGFPGARITLHVRESMVPLLAGAHWFDEVLPLTSYHRGPAALLREAAALRGRRFDLGLCLPDSFSSALLMRLGRVARIVGYRGQVRGLLLDDSPPAPPADETGRRMLARELHVLGLVEALGCPRQGTELELFVTEAEEAEARAALDACGVRDGDEMVALAPGASYGSSKLWPAESFARVGDVLAGTGLRVVILGTREERALAAQVTRAMAAPAADLAGAIGIGALKAVLRRSRVLVCNDAGARHVAVAFGVPCVVLMGPTSLEKTNLNLERVAVLSAEGVSCRPCYLRDCPIDHRCMTGIDPDRASAAARRALSLVAAGPAG